MTSGVSRVESDRGRVRALLQPSTKQDKGDQREGSSLLPRLR
jgi:hypothetical protein